MEKNNIRLTESDLRNIVKESVKKVIREGHWDSNVWDEFQSLREKLGDDTLISELYEYLDGDTIDDFIETTKRNYDLDNEDYEY